MWRSTSGVAVDDVVPSMGFGSPGIREEEGEVGRRSGWMFLAAGLAALALGGTARADEGKLLLTGGVSQVEGAGGGGLVPWALISGYETRDGIGVTVHMTYVPVSKFTLYSPGFAVGIHDRVEISYASDSFDTGTSLAPFYGALSSFGVRNGFAFRQDVFGLKVKVYGDAVYDQDRLLPQIAIGGFYKEDEDHGLTRALGAKETNGIDYYVAATKLILSQSLLLDATIRMTKANEFGILGFGGPTNNDYQAEFEGSAAFLVSKRFVVGAEFRQKPNNGLIGGAEGEERAYDIFTAYALNKHVSLTGGFVDLGKIATYARQRGAYLSLQFAY
jgi:hypothetical protein